MPFPYKKIAASIIPLLIAAVAFSQAMNPPMNGPRPIEAADTVFIERMTWMEVRDALHDGKTTALIATGGVEQNGPYMEAGAHQTILTAITDQIARKLGNTLVAPLINYVPEGDIDPPTGHMLYPSTLSVSEQTFQAILTDAANSLRAHGFENIVLIGDSGGNQKGMKAVAATLSKNWKGKTNKFGKSPRIHYIPEYYNNALWNKWLAKQGYHEKREGIHDDLRHASILMAADPSSIRYEERKRAGKLSINGIDISDANKIAKLGRRLIDYHASVTANAIQAAVAIPVAEVSSPRHGVIGIQKGTLVQFDKRGNVVWSYHGIPDAHTIQELPDGNILTQNSWTRVIELNRQGEIVWSYDAAVMNGNQGKEIEVHAALRLKNGLTMIAECGSARLIEVDENGHLHHEIKLTIDHPNPHRDTRRVHLLENDNYLVAHEGDGAVREYNRQGKVVWQYSVSMQGKPFASGHGPEAWGNRVNNAIRLQNGNTLIATGNQHSVLEVNPAGEIVWSLLPGDLPDMVFAMTKQLEELPNGNFIIGNTYGNENYPQLLEINRDKEILWTFKDFSLLGNYTSAICTTGNLQVVNR